MHGPTLTTAEIRIKLARELAALVRLGVSRDRAIDTIAQQRGIRALALHKLLGTPPVDRTHREAA